MYLGHKWELNEIEFVACFQKLNSIDFGAFQKFHPCTFSPGQVMPKMFWFPRTKLKIFCTLPGIATFYTFSVPINSEKISLRLSGPGTGSRRRVPVPGPGPGSRRRVPVPGPGPGSRRRDPVSGVFSRSLALSRLHWHMHCCYYILKSGTRSFFAAMVRGPISKAEAGDVLVKKEPQEKVRLSRTKAKIQEWLGSA